MTSWLLRWQGRGGALLGSIFFGGLWWTVRQGVCPKPVLWFLGSLLLRAI